MECTSCHKPITDQVSHTGTAASSCNFFMLPCVLLSASLLPSLAVSATHPGPCSQVGTVE